MVCPDRRFLFVAVYMSFSSFLFKVSEIVAYRFSLLFVVNDFRSWLSLWQEEETTPSLAILSLKPFTGKMLVHCLHYPLGEACKSNSLDGIDMSTLCSFIYH